MKTKGIVTIVITLFTSFIIFLLIKPLRDNHKRMQQSTTGNTSLKQAGNDR